MNITELLFAIIRAEEAEQRRIFSSLSASQWQQLYDLAVEQGVAAIVWESIEQAMANGVISAEMMPERELKLRWAMGVEQVEQKYDRQRRVIAKMASYLAEQGIKMLILKGYGLSLNYPQPRHRPCGDVDVWFFEERKADDGSIMRVNVWERADELLRQRFNIEIDKDKHHHTVFYLDGVMVENHYDFLNVHAHRSNRTIECWLNALVQEEIEKTQVDGQSIYLPSANFHTLFLLRHSASHFAAEKIGVRHLLDWNYYLIKYGNRVDWQRLETYAQRMNMHRFLHALNAICIDNLGLSAGAIPPFERDVELEERVLNEILHPEFSEHKPAGAGYLRSWSYMLRRWWANRWKHRIVYREGLVETFLVQLWSHLLKPKSLKLR